MRVHLFSDLHHFGVYWLRLQVQPESVALAVQVFELRLELIDSHVRLLLLFDLSVGELGQVVAIHLADNVLIRDVGVVLLERGGSRSDLLLMLDVVSPFMEAFVPVRDLRVFITLVPAVDL